MASLSSAVPLTTCNLPHEDRARLIRTTRKIGEVVGETPLVVDISSLAPAQKPHAKLKRSKHTFRSEPSESAPPLVSDTRPLLYIRVPDPLPADHVPPTPAPSPTLTVALNIRPAMHKDDAARRRKMAKLGRTLGVPVPPELVFPPENLNDRCYRRLTSRTVKTDRTSRVEARRLSSTSGASRTTRKLAEENSISRGWVWVGKREEIPSDVRARMQRSRMESGLPFDWVSVGRLEELPEDEEATPRQHPAIPTTRKMYRKETGWSGEWAGDVQNMDDVVRQLRGLKAK
ncbi:hypothetical protein B0H19DRAFT_1259089 [Mycena capillaripes]|nr:hypothetical protein B0H19DRAFT_1259089 [Mycena capillaripes]